MEDSTWDDDVPPVTDEEIASTLAELGGVDVLDKACLNGESYGGACALHRQPDDGNTAATARARALGVSENEAWGIMAGWDYGGASDQHRDMCAHNTSVQGTEQAAAFNRGVRRGRRLAELVRRGTVA